MQKRILIAEDDESIMKLEKRILEDAGYAVDCAKTGDMALELVRQFKYALVIADVMMPGVDGFDLTREVKKLYNRKVPVLIVTAMNQPLKAAHERDAKPMSAIQKPFTPQALLTAVRLLEGQQAMMSKPPRDPLAAPASKPKPAKKRTSARKSKPAGWFDRLFQSSDSKKKR